MRPGGVVVDYRTPVSGVRRGDVEGAPALSQVRDTVRGLLRGRAVVIARACLVSLSVTSQFSRVPQMAVNDGQICDLE